MDYIHYYNKKLKINNKIDKIWPKEDNINKKIIPSIKNESINKFLKYFNTLFQIKNFSNYFVKYSLNHFVKIYKITPNAPLLILELNFIVDKKTGIYNYPKFIDIKTKIFETNNLSNNILEDLIFLGKISTILKSKKIEIIQKYEKNYCSYIKKRKIQTSKLKKLNFKLSVLQKQNSLNCFKCLKSEIFKKEIFNFNDNIDIPLRNIQFKKSRSFHFKKIGPNLNKLFFTSHLPENNFDLVLNDTETSTVIFYISKFTSLGINYFNSWDKKK